MASYVSFVEITYSGETSAIDAGTYEVKCVCDDNCYFFETGTNTCYTTWEIKKCLLSSPTAKKKYPYTGEVITPEFNYYSPDVLSISGDVSGIEIGDYVALFDIIDKENYEWKPEVVLSAKNGGKAAVSWEIITSVKTVAIPYQSNHPVYNGEKQSPTFYNYNTNYVQMLGATPSEINAGEYWVTFKLKENCVWSDGTTENKKVKWQIYPVRLSYPTILTSEATGGMYYYELEGKRYPIWRNYDSDILFMSGDMYDIDNSWHITYFDIKDKTNYVWNKDGTTDTYAVRWKLSEPYDPTRISASGLLVHIPRQILPPYEDGSTKYPTWDSFYDGAIIKSGGIWHGELADTYYVILELNDGFVWEDGTTEIKVVPWVIRSTTDVSSDDTDYLIPIHIPEQINIPYYDGLVKEPEWDEWDKYGIDIVEGDLYGMPAGIYYLTLRPQTGYIWEDGTIEDKVITWVINPREEIDDADIPRDPAPERDGDESKSEDTGCGCCCCCDTGLYDILKNACPEDTEHCDCT